MALPDLITTARLELRRFRAVDAPAVLAYWRSDGDWAKFNLSVRKDAQLVDSERFVKARITEESINASSWAVTLDDEVVGIVSLGFSGDQAQATVGYGIHGALRGRGLIAEAVRAVLTRVFTDSSTLVKVVANTDSRNIASHRVLEKLGFVLSGEDLQGGAVFELTRDSWKLSC